MSKDKACISAVKEVCQRCHLYKENCGMLDFPDQCSISGRYIDGYRQAEKDLELTWGDIPKLFSISEQLKTSWWFRDNEQTKQIGTQVFWEEVLKRFKDYKERKQK